MAIFIHNAAGPYTNQMVNSTQFTRTGTHRGNLKVRVKSAESGTDLNTLFRNSDNIYVQKDNSTAANDSPAAAGAGTQAKYIAKE